MWLVDDVLPCYFVLTIMRYRRIPCGCVTSGSYESRIYTGSRSDHRNAEQLFKVGRPHSYGVEYGSVNVTDNSK